MKITNYFAIAAIVAAPSALMAEDNVTALTHNYGADLSFGVRVDENENYEYTLTSRVHVPVYDIFGVQADLDVSENDDGFVQIGGTIHGTIDVTDYVTVGAFYGHNSFDGSTVSHQGIEGVVNFDVFEVSGIAGTLDNEVEYYMLDGNVNVFTDYTVGLRFDKIESLDVVTSVYAASHLSNGFGVEFRMQDVEDTQARTFGLTLTKALGNGARFQDAKSMIAPIS